VQPAYVDGWLAQLADGWRYRCGETDLRASCEVPGLGEVELHGRVDRIDHRGDATRVIDYKTSRVDTLKSKLRNPGEAVQLPFYAWLAEAEAAFLPLGDTAVAPLALGGETDVEAIALRLTRLLEAIANRAGLRAQGVESVCQYCEARGLCRKGMWSER
jgi:ATP-dependent helicase/nuclease subunit B